VNRSAGTAKASRTSTKPSVDSRSLFFPGLVICCSSRLIFKPKADLNSDLEFFDFVFFNQPAHFGHFNPVGVNFATCACAQAPNALGAGVVLDSKFILTREGLPSTIRQV
jgi:hypothetical protein